VWWLLACAACGRFGFGGSSTADATPDASVDTMIDAMTDAPGCAGVFCDDFDGPALGATWDGKIGATLAFDMTMPVSAPQSFAATSPTGQPNGTQVTLYKTFAPAFTAGTIDVDVRINAYGSATTRVTMARVVLGTGSIGIGTHQNSSNLIEITPGGITNMTTTTATLPFGTWTHVRLAVDIPARTATIFYDGTTVATATIDASTAAAPPRLEVGLPWIENTSTPWVVDLDNLVFAY